MNRIKIKKDTKFKIGDLLYRDGVDKYKVIDISDNGYKFKLQSLFDNRMTYDWPEWYWFDPVFDSRYGTALKYKNWALCKITRKLLIFNEQLKQIIGENND